MFSYVFTRELVKIEAFDRDGYIRFCAAWWTIDNKPRIELMFGSFHRTWRLNRPNS